MRTARQLGQSDLGLAQGSYIYAIRPLGGHAGLVASCSDSNLRFLDMARLEVRSTLTVSGGGNSTISQELPHITALCTAGQLVYAGKSDGGVQAWDPRMDVGAFLLPPAPAPVASLAVSGRSGTSAKVAVGTELHNHAAVVSVWDVRRVRSGGGDGGGGGGGGGNGGAEITWDWSTAEQPLARYEEAHNDDVTELAWSTQVGQGDRFLLSGGTDGVVNIYDTTEPDPDEALVRSLNPGSSVSHAGFLPSHNGDDLSREGVFSISHDERMTTWELPVREGADVAGRKRYIDGEEDEGPEADDRARDYGDVRPQLDCEYVVDVVTYGIDGPNASFRQKLLGVGKHSERRLDIMPLRHGMDLRRDNPDAVTLPGAHGEEIVRSFYVDHATDTIYTCGEDGQVKNWRVEQESTTAGAATTTAGPLRARPKKHLFKPY